MPTPRKPDTAFVRLTNRNQVWVAERSLTTGQSMTKVANMALDFARNAKSFEIPHHEPKYLITMREKEAARKRRLLDQMRKKAKQAKRERERVYDEARRAQRAEA